MLILQVHKNTHAAGIAMNGPIGLQVKQTHLM